MALAHPTLQQEAREAIACDYFIDPLDDADFALKVRERAPPSLDEALRVVLQLEAWAKDARRSRGEQAPQSKLKVRGAVDVDAVSFIERLDRLEAIFNKRFDKLLKLHEASMVRPEAVVVKAPSAGVQPARGLPMCVR